MLVAFLMTLYAGILSPLDSGVQSTDITSTLAVGTQQVQADPGRKPCDVAWPGCQPPNPNSAVAELTSTAPEGCGNVAWPDACPPPRGNSVVLQAKDPGGIGHPGGVEWPGSAGVTVASSRPPLTGPGVEWPMT